MFLAESLVCMCACRGTHRVGEREKETETDTQAKKDRHTHTWGGMDSLKMFSQCQHKNSSHLKGSERVDSGMMYQ